MFEINENSKSFIQEELKKYEDPHSAIIPSLFRIQKDNGGYISREMISALSKEMDLPESRINEVFHFYTMFNKKPVGKYHVQVCTNISCSMNEGRELISDLCQKFSVKEGEVTGDGRYSFSRVECLGSCDTAPMMQVNEEYFENLNYERALGLLQELP